MYNKYIKIFMGNIKIQQGHTQYILKPLLVLLFYNEGISWVNML